MTASVFDGAERIPRVGITIGDAAGIGPEISLKAVAHGEFRAFCHPVFVGDLAFLRSTASKLGLEIDFVEFGDSSQNKAPGFEVFDLKNLPEVITVGTDAAVTGEASAEYIKAAVDLWKLGKLDAIATAPISKKPSRSVATISRAILNFWPS